MSSCPSLTEKQRNNWNVYWPRAPSCRAALSDAWGVQQPWGALTLQRALAASPPGLQGGKKVWSNVVFSSQPRSSYSSPPLPFGAAQNLGRDVHCTGTVQHLFFPPFLPEVPTRRFPWLETVLFLPPPPLVLPPPPRSPTKSCVPSSKEGCEREGGQKKGGDGRGNLLSHTCRYVLQRPRRLGGLPPLPSPLPPPASTPPPPHSLPGQANMTAALRRKTTVDPRTCE